MVDGEKLYGCDKCDIFNIANIWRYQKWHMVKITIWYVLAYTVVVWTAWQMGRSFMNVTKLNFQHSKQKTWHKVYSSNHHRIYTSSFIPVVSTGWQIGISCTGVTNVEQLDSKHLKVLNMTSNINYNRRYSNSGIVVFTTSCQMGESCTWCDKCEMVTIINNWKYETVNTLEITT